MILGAFALLMLPPHAGQAGGLYAEDAPPHRYGWAGTYAGLTLGAAGLGADIERGPGSGELEIDERGVVLGVVAGHNFAMAGRGSSLGQWLFGIEADIIGGDLGDSEADALLGSVEAEASWLASARLRGGYAWERVYLYGTAGVAFSDITASSTGAAADDDVRAGLALGAGAELALGEGWAARLEAMSYSFAESDVTVAGAERDADLGFSSLRLGLTRRF
jgi:outer membrane immunogenic protein